MGHEPQTKVVQRTLAEGRLLGAKAIQHHLPALVHHREFHGVAVAYVTIGLQSGSEGQHPGFHGLFAARLRTIGLCQSVLERGIQQRMTALAQKHKEFSRLACACSNFLFFQGQRNRWIPHRVLLQMGGVCSSSTYKSTAPPVVSTLSELLSKQLISVLGRVPPQDGPQRCSAAGRSPLCSALGLWAFLGLGGPHTLWLLALQAGVFIQGGMDRRRHLGLIGRVLVRRFARNSRAERDPLARSLVAPEARLLGRRLRLAAVMLLLALGL